MGIFTVPKCSFETLLWAFILWPISGMGITIGAHRLWSHRSFTATLPVRILLMIFQSIANQGSIYHWARDHRVHHKHSETSADPHNASRGFFFAHMGWLMVKKDKRVTMAGRELHYEDLTEDGVVTFQKALDPMFAMVMCFIMPAVVAMWGWDEDFLYAFVVAGVLRYCLVLHFTWMVNSAAHLYGDHPYDTLSYPAENPVVAFVSVGEGWHNWHHKYPYDYAASEFGVSSQFNPSKLVIDGFACLGLVSERKRATGAWRMGMVRRDRELRAGVIVSKTVPRHWEVSLQKQE